MEYCETCRNICIVKQLSLKLKKELDTRVFRPKVWLLEKMFTVVHRSLIGQHLKTGIWIIKPRVYNVKKKSL